MAIMSAAPADHHRGTHLLLVHCAALEPAKPTAFARLESAIGKELARLLVYALVGRPGRQARRR
ncbi:MAG TPA: hypothetical protein VFA82_00385 [Gaiellaceae bacterium]|nr:hypothetical protein [Gaiellaceae bacterium]